MYLTRLMLNARSRRAQSEVASPYEMHRTLMCAFPDDLDRASERVLWRVDPLRDRPLLCVLVQSVAEPDWSWLADPGHAAGLRGYLSESERPNPAIKTFEPGFAQGQVLSFLLRANPTAKRAGKRVGLYRYEDQIRWLERKASTAGFGLVRVDARQEGTSGGFIHRKERTHRVTHLAVRFLGLLRVEDPESFGEAVRSGIGSAKGFGFGLLSLGPPQ